VTYRKAEIKEIVGKDGIIDGADAESDVGLRDRAKMALSLAARATQDSIESAVQGVPGVMARTVKIEDNQDVPGLIKVTAVINDQGEGLDKTKNEIKNVIDKMKAAGIRYELNTPSLQVDDFTVSFTIEGGQGESAQEIKEKVRDAIDDYLKNLDVGDDVKLSQIVKRALSVDGVLDIRNVKIDDKNENKRIMSGHKGHLKDDGLMIDYLQEARK
jgi:uncharacterized phage protein gp47/JayE